MFDPGKFIKKIRKEHKLSHRNFAKQVNMSYRQIQRIEKDQSSITVKKLNSILNTFDLFIKIHHKEPDWNILFNFGLPINIENNHLKKYNYDEIEKEIVQTSNFLLENKNNVEYLRHFDAFKALLLALKIHYPSKFNKINEVCTIDLVDKFELTNILGKHIKLRNICLAGISNFFRKQEFK